LEAAPVDVEMGIGHEDNAPRAMRAVDRHPDEVWGLGARTRASLFLDPHLRLDYGGGLRYNRSLRFGATSFGQATLDGGLIYKPDLAYTAPWYGVDVRGSYRQHEASAIRDGGLVDLSIFRGQRLTDRLELKGGYGLEARRAVQAAVFDLDVHRAFVDAEWTLSRTFQLYSGFAYRFGDVVSTNPPAPALLQLARARAEDPALCLAPLCMAYRLPGEGYQAGLGVVMRLSPQAAVDVGGRYFETFAAGGNAYHGYWIGGSFLYRLP
jgi:hypothetical protein